MKSLKESLMLGVLFGVLLAQVACGGNQGPESPCTDANGVQYPCEITGICNMTLDGAASPRVCEIPDDGNCCLPDPAG